MNDRVMSLSLLAAVLLVVVRCEPCTNSDLGVFQEVKKPVAQCSAATGIKVELPPRGPIQKEQKMQLCGTKACLAMLGAIDDLSIPRCDVTFNKQNVTLQTSLDRFASLCDDSAPAPSPLKKKKSSSSSSSGSGSSSGSSDKRHKQKSAATSTFQLSSVVVVAAMTLGIAQSIM